MRTLPFIFGVRTPLANALPFTMQRVALRVPRQVHVVLVGVVDGFAVIRRTTSKIGGVVRDDRSLEGLESLVVAFCLPLFGVRPLLLLSSHKAVPDL